MSVQACKIYQQDISDKRIVIVNWAPWLGEGPIISSVTWDVPSRLSAEDDSFTSTTSTNYFLANANTRNGNDYTVKCTIVTDENVPRSKSVSFKVRIGGNCD